MIRKIKDKLKTYIIIRKIRNIIKKIEVNIILSKLKLNEKELVSNLCDRGLTYLSEKKLVNILNTCKKINETNLSGIFIEAGCALGGSSILISKMKTLKRPFYIYDVFGMIPSPTEQDTYDVHKRYKTIVEGKSTGLKGNKYYGYEEGLYKLVKSNLLDFDIDCKKESVMLIKGLVQDTMKINEPVAFAHIDVDWYEPVKTCLEQIFPNLVVGGSLILDDYHDWGGCRKATDEFLRKVVGQFSMEDSYGSVKITRIH